MFFCSHGPFECVVEDEKWIQKVFHKVDISEIQLLDEFCLCDTADYALLQMICLQLSQFIFFVNSTEGPFK